MVIPNLGGKTILKNFRYIRIVPRGGNSQLEETNFLSKNLEGGVLNWKPEGPNLNLRNNLRKTEGGGGNWELEVLLEENKGGTRRFLAL